MMTSKVLLTMMMVLALQNTLHQYRYVALLDGRVGHRCNVVMKGPNECMCS
jgi:hypothetical protein